MPKFSVVIPLFNKEKFILSTLKSVMNQNFKDFEVIIVDDGSTDKSAEIVNAFTDKRINYFYQENKGAATTRNVAIKKASGDFIALLDADDYWYPSYLEEQNRLIENYKDEAVFATAQEIVSGSHRYALTYSLPENFNKDGLVNFFEASLISPILHSSSTVLKKEVFHKSGYYDPDIVSGEDTDLYIRIGLNFEVVFSTKICSSYHIVKNGLFRSTSSLAEKIKLEKYKQEEIKNPRIKKFLDINRYALAITTKLNNDREGFVKLSTEINKNNLNKKQRVLLMLPSQMLRLLNQFKYVLQEKLGVNLSAFK
ncbi:MAG: glycosyltransferase family 2 protein [Mesonia hippocampi]|uniref:glycosyltransferase family 2 protein n=1 Tax=Mesonia hippocampi TaxID=1628250 RepID=UPI003F9A8804